MLIVLQTLHLDQLYLSYKQGHIQRNMDSDIHIYDIRFVVTYGGVYVLYCSENVQFLRKLIASLLICFSGYVGIQVRIW